MGDRYQYYGYLPEVWAEAFAEKTLLEDGPAGTTAVADGMVLPLRRIPGTVEQYGDGVFEGGVVDAEGEFVAGQFRTVDRAFSNRSIARGYALHEGDPVTYRDESVIFGGMAVRHWGHMLVDTTSRLWYPVTHPEDRRKIVFVRFPGQEFPYAELLSLAGITPDRYEIIDEPTRFREILIPEETSHSISGHYRREWISFFDAVRSHVTPTSYKKVYLTRTAFAINNVCGEKYFEDFFAAQGYTVISPEKLSITEQVAVLAGAEEIATTMGTISHLGLFASPDAHMTVLNRSREIVRLQLTLNKARGLRCTYVDVYRNFLPEVQGGNCVFLLAPNEAWRRYIQDAFGIPSDPAADDAVFGRTALEYIRGWGSFFEEKKKFKWIRNYEVKNLVADINRTFLDKEIDTSDYLPTVETDRLRAALLASEIDAGRICDVDAIREQDGALALSGRWQSPFCDPGNLRFSAALRPSGIGSDESSSEKQFPVDVTVTVPEGSREARWDIAIDLPAACRWLETCENTKEKDRIEICLQIEDSFEKRVLPLADPGTQTRTEYRGFSTLYRTGEQYLWLDVTEDRRVVLTVKTAEEVLRRPAKASVTEILTSEKTLVLRGSLEAAAACDPELAISGGVRRFAAEDGPAEFVPAEIHVQRESQRSLTWQMTIYPEEILARSEEGGRLRWDPCLVLSLRGAERSLRFGFAAHSPARERFLAKMWMGKNRMLLCGETGKKNLSLYARPLSEAVQRFWIEDVAWDETGLQMSGTLQMRPPCHAEEVDFLLINPENVVWYEEPLRLEGDDSRPSPWKLKLACTRLLPVLRSALEALLSEGESDPKSRSVTCQLAIRIRIGEQTAILPIGDKRKPGSLARYQRIPDIAEDLRLSGIKVGKAEYLGLRAERKAPPKEEPRKGRFTDWFKRGR